MSVDVPVYFDYAATTPVDPEVAQAMSECLLSSKTFGNPSSMSHEYGRTARGIVEAARAQVAKLIGVQSNCILWTSGATESDNLAVFGLARYHSDRGKHVVSARTEHKAVLDPLKQLERAGFEVTYLKPDGHGIVHPEQVAAALRTDTILVSLMHVNNETGVIQDVAAVGALCRERSVIFHVDAAQSAGKIPIDADSMNIDALSLTAHKVYGPKGIGALYLRAKPPLGIQPLHFGGGQERGLRSGTLATHQILGMGKAFEIAHTRMFTDAQRIEALRDRLWEGVSVLGGIELNGHPQRRVCGVLNVAVHDVEGESLQFALRDLALSAGAACSSGTDESSYVLRALGRSDALAQSSLRFSLGRFTTAEEVEFAIATVTREIPRLRSLGLAASGAG